MLKFQINNSDLERMKQQQSQQATQAPLNINAQNNVNGAIQRAVSSSLWGGDTNNGK